jgi:hypothetical protein
MVKSHPANHTVPMKVWCSIRIFRIPSPCSSVPTIPSADKKVWDSLTLPHEAHQPITDRRPTGLEIYTSLFGFHADISYTSSQTARKGGHAVAEEKSEGAAEMKDLTSTSFGYVIAFLLPGLLGLYALSYWSGGIRQLLQPALKAEATVGPSVILLLIALGVGLCISAIRFFAFEKLLCRQHSFPADMFAKLTAENKLGSFKAVVDEHYRYHQFYGGCAVALAILYGGWIRGQTYADRCGSLILVTVGFLVFEALLISTAADSFKRYVARGTTIVQGGEVPHAHQG